MATFLQIARWCCLGIAGIICQTAWSTIALVPFVTVPEGQDAVQINSLYTVSNDIGPQSLRYRIWMSTEPINDYSFKETIFSSEGSVDGTPADVPYTFLYTFTPEDPFGDVYFHVTVNVNELTQRGFMFSVHRDAEGTIVTAAVLDEPVDIPEGTPANTVLQMSESFGNALKNWFGNFQEWASYFWYQQRSWWYKQIMPNTETWNRIDNWEIPQTCFISQIHTMTNQLSYCFTAAQTYTVPTTASDFITVTYKKGGVWTREAIAVNFTIIPQYLLAPPPANQVDTWGQMPAMDEAFIEGASRNELNYYTANFLHLTVRPIVIGMSVALFLLMVKRKSDARWIV